MNTPHISDTFTWKDAVQALLEQQAELDDEKINDGPIYIQDIQERNRLKSGEIDATDG